MFGRRPDATLVRDVDPIRAFMPLLIPRRGDALVYFEQTIDVEDTLERLEHREGSRAPDAPPITLFHLLLAAIARTLHARPQLNRFSAGGHLWQREGVHLTFSAKARFDDDARLLTIKRRFEPDEPLEALSAELLARLKARRGGERDRADREMGLLLRLPRPLTRLALALARWADARGLLPRSMIEPDPLFCSVFVANLGSVGLDAAYHHLWEWGTCPVFCTLGRIHPRDGRRHVTLRWTFDERTADGFYAARALELVRGHLERGDLL